MSIQTETGAQKCLIESEIPNFGAGGGGNLETDDKGLKPSERLEACINSMMKKAEMLHPSPEEQILQKQQILEELQRVERELQEKAHAQLLLTQHQQQHHHQGVQALGTVVAGTPTISAITNNSPNSLSNLATVAGAHQQLIFNDAVLDIESLQSLTDISSVTNHMGLNLQLTTSANNLTFPQAVHSPQFYNQPQTQQQVQKVVQQSVITTTTPAADYCKSRTNKPVKQAKTVMKQTSQQPFQLQTMQGDVKMDPQPPVEEMEKLNLRSVSFSDQQPMTPQQLQLQQQLLQQQHSQQQFVLSEFTQNLTLRGTKYCEGAIAGIMQAMGGIKLTSDSTQTHAIPMYDPVTVGQALLQQQFHQQQQQHLVQHQQLQVIQEAKRQQQPQSPQQQTLQQLSHPQHFEKNVKVLKGKTNKVQQQSLLHANQAPLPSLQSPQTQQLIKQQFATCGETCTLVGNIPIDGSGVLTLSGMPAPAFPVSIAVSPVSLPASVSIATSCGSAFTHNLALDEGLMVAAPARTLHETLGDIMTGM